MPEDRVTGYVEQGLEEVRLVMKRWAWTLLTLGTSRDSGLNLVPREGPPTWSSNELGPGVILHGAYQDDSFGRG